MNHLLFALASVVIVMATPDFHCYVVSRGRSTAHAIYVNFLGVPHFGEAPSCDQLLEPVTKNLSHGHAFFSRGKSGLLTAGQSVTNRDWHGFSFLFSRA
jgi:hypothetical protein